MWEGNLNSDAAVSTFTEDLSKHIGTGSFETDYGDLCTKYNITPCPYVSFIEGTIVIHDCIIDLSSWRCVLIASCAPAIGLLGLKLHNCELSGQHLVDLAFMLTRSDAALQMLKLEYLTFQNNSGDWLAALGALFASEMKIEYLSLRGLALNDEIILRNTTLLGTNFYMKCLNLSDNKITDVGATELMRILRFNVSLRQVSFAKNLITGVGCMDTLVSILAGSPASSEDDSAARAIVKGFGDMNRKIKDINKRRKKDKLTDIPELRPSKERNLRIDGGPTVVNRLINTIDFMKNPLVWNTVTTALQKMATNCGPSGVTTAFGPCSVSFLFSNATTKDITFTVDETLSQGLQDIGISLQL